VKSDEHRLSITARLTYAALAVSLAFGGSITATVAYDTYVAMPSEVELRPEPPPPAAQLPPPESPPSEPPIDPMQQALATIYGGLPATAVLEVQAQQIGSVVYLVGEAESRRTVALAAEAIGQVAGVRAVDVRRMAIVDRTHTVAEGETLSRIAHHYYGESSAWRRIVDANPGLEPDRVRPGTALVIPPLDR
jgi:nucleoid-associated protein YgaU